MPDAGRASSAAAEDRLTEYAAAAEPDRVAAAADEILSVADLLRREPRLRRALTDPARSGDERSALLAAVLAGKVRDDALGLLTALVSERWSSPGGLLDATERLGVGELAEIEDELFRFGQVVAGDRRLAAALGDSSAPVARRAALVRQLLADRARPATVRLAEVALTGFGGRGFAASLTRLVELAAQWRDRAVAYVTTAVPLSDEEEQRLSATLSEMYGQQISLKVDVDPSVIGGARVRVGPDLYDGTISRRFDQSRKALAG